MKAPVILYCFVLLLPLNTFYAQNYRCINPDRIAFFEGVTDYRNEILAIRIDSILINGEDTVLYSFYDLQSIDDYYDGCCSPNFSSWIGKKIISQASGTNIFINKESDSIFIETLADSGETWNCYSRDSSMIITACVEYIDTVSILGIKDSVKTISFHAVYTKDSTKQHPINKMNIKISKAHGLLSTLNFNLFPDFEQLDPFSYGQINLNEFNLVGLTNPDIGITNLTWLDVHDYDVGDEFHAEYVEYTIHQPPDYYVSDKIIKRIIGKTDKGDTLCYQFEILRERTYSSEGKTSVTLHNYFEHPCYTSNPWFDRLPRELTREDQYNLDFLIMANSDPPVKYDEPCLGYGLAYDQCWMNMICDGCFIRNVYAKGLGIRSYGCEGGVQGFTSVDFKLIYYKKGITQWGIPIFISSTNRVSSRPSSVYPNPFGEFVTVNLMEGNHFPCNIRIFDTSGRMIYAHTVRRGNVFQLDLSRLRSGIYFYTLDARGMLVERGKLIAL